MNVKEAREAAEPYNTASFSSNPAHDNPFAKRELPKKLP
jgi:hypothetical protein